ncbi:hypothetical protein LCGC14_2485860, partial [marine sediment metagenome]
RSHYWVFARKRKQALLHSKTITGATQMNPVVITSVAHGFANGDEIRIEDILGMTELNGNKYLVASQVADSFSLNDFDGTTIDGTGFTAYTSAGKVKPFSFGYADTYTFPSDYLKLHYIGNDAISDYKRKYEIQGNQVLLNNSGASTLSVGYIKDETDVTRFDPLFIILFAAELAENMAFKWTLKNSVIKRLEGILERRRAEARSVNGQDRPPVRYERSKFISARRRLRNDAGVNTIFDF